MKVIIAGSRRLPSVGLTDPSHWQVPRVREKMMELLEEAVEKSGFQIDTVVSGRCWGIDQLGEEYAAKHGLPVEPYPADWDKFGRRAGHLRNVQMADHADALICIAAEGSTGSMDMIDIMKEKNKPLFAMILDG